MTKSTEDPRPLGDDGWAPKDAFLCISQVDQQSPPTRGLSELERLSSMARILDKRQRKFTGN
jgi:hypothetical protein